MKKLHLISLGCTKNLVDSEVMLGKLQDYELTQDISEADVIIINSCGFIQSAKEESLQHIFQAHQQRKKDSILVMAGCLSQRYKDELQQELTEVDIFTGVGDYDKIDKIISQKQSLFSNKVFLNDEKSDRIIANSTYHAYIKLSEGCNQQCSFCAIPSFKGKLQSRTLESIKQEITKLVQLGYWDFTFISQDSSSYLRDFDKKDGLIDLIQMVEGIDGVKNAKILYLYPSTLSIEVIDKIAASNIFQTYYDMPLQHITNKMLKIMKRGSKKEKIITLLDRMKQHNGFIRSTFIVGHPYETQKDFEQLCKFVQDFEFDRANIFSYSDEEDTLAYKMSNKIPQKIINERADILGEIVTNTTQKSLIKDINNIYDIVIEGVSDEHEYLLKAKKLLWESDIDGEILINDSEIENLQFNQIYKAKITEIAKDKLIATVIF